MKKSSKQGKSEHPKKEVRLTWISTAQAAELFNCSQKHLMKLKARKALKRGTHWIDISTGDGRRSTYRWHLKNCLAAMGKLEDWLLTNYGCNQRLEETPLSPPRGNSSSWLGTTPRRVCCECQCTLESLVHLHQNVHQNPRDLPPLP